MVRKLLILICLLVAGCSGGAVVFAPTPPPVGQTPIRYTHPSGVFSVILPGQWSVYEQNTTTLATAAFSMPDSAEPSLLFAVINLGKDIDSNSFGDLINLYQTTVRPDTGRYVEQDRQAMGDGSWRMTGLRSGTGGATEQDNTFIEHQGQLVGLIDVLLPSDPTQLQLVQSIVNSFTINASASLQPTDLTTLAYAKDSSLGILHVATWSTPAGVFFITGEVANYGLTTVTDVPVEVDLRGADGVTVQGAVDKIMGYGIPPGGFAPFSLRFGGGQPSLATNYTVTLGGQNWQPNADNPTIYGQNEMTWTDESQFDNLNRLVISGTVTNISQNPIREPRATVTVFDGQQNVIAAGFADITPSISASGTAEATSSAASATEAVGTGILEPGQTTPFSITLPEMGGNPQNYIVNIQGLP